MDHRLLRLGKTLVHQIAANRHRKMFVIGLLNIHQSPSKYMMENHFLLNEARIKVVHLNHEMFKEHFKMR